MLVAPAPPDLLVTAAGATTPPCTATPPHALHQYLLSRSTCTEELTEIESSSDEAAAAALAGSPTQSVTSGLDLPSFPPAPSSSPVPQLLPLMPSFLVPMQHVTEGDAVDRLDTCDDVWLSKILSFLTLKEILPLQSLSRTWRVRVGVFVSNMTSLHWDNRWPVAKLSEVVKQAPARRLSALNLNSCFHMDDRAMKSLMEHLNGDSLSALDLSGIPTLSDVGMSIVAASCPRLETLILRGCRRIGGQDGEWPWMSHLASRGRLRVVDLYCTAANDLAVSRLVPQSPSLVKLDLGVLHWGGVTDASLSLIGRYCPRLEHLDIRGCRHVTSQGIGAVVSSCPNLALLGLHSCNVDDDALASIGERCNKLAWLNLHRCARVTDQGVIALFSGRVAASVQFLDVSNLNITDHALHEMASALARHGARLGTFDCRSCRTITGEGILGVVQASHRTLVHLDVNGCNVSMPVLFRIARLCSGVLRHFEIGGVSAAVAAAAAAAAATGGGGGEGGTGAGAQFGVEDDIFIPGAAAMVSPGETVDVQALKVVLGPQAMVYAAF